MDCHQTHRTHTLARDVQNLYGYALRLTRNHDDAQDLLQDTFLRAFRSVENWEPSLPTGAWLRRIMKNCFIDILRKRVAERKYLSLMASEDALQTREWRQADEEASTEEEMLVHELQACVRGAISELGINHSEIVNLHYLKELSVGEIVRLTGLCPGTVRSRLARARAQLRSSLMKLVANE